LIDSSFAYQATPTSQGQALLAEAVGSKGHVHIKVRVSVRFRARMRVVLIQEKYAVSSKFDESAKILGYDSVKYVVSTKNLTSQPNWSDSTKKHAVSAKSC